MISSVISSCCSAPVTLIGGLENGIEDLLRQRIGRGAARHNEHALLAPFFVVYRHWLADAVCISDQKISQTKPERLFTIPGLRKPPHH
jgi:hypothetical protein